MKLERIFTKKALYFIILASKSENIISAIDFFNKNFDLSDIPREDHQSYRDTWAAVLLDALNSLPSEKKKILSIAFIEPQSSDQVFCMTGTDLRFDIIALKQSDNPDDSLNIK